MYIHLGGDVVIQTKEIIAILDFNHRDWDKKSHSFIEELEKTETLTWIVKNATKSIVVTEKGTYGSPISSFTLNKRAFGETGRY